MNRGRGPVVWGRGTAREKRAWQKSHMRVAFAADRRDMCERYDRPSVQRADASYRDAIAYVADPHWDHECGGERFCEGCHFAVDSLYWVRAESE